MDSKKIASYLLCIIAAYPFIGIRLTIYFIILFCIATLHYVVKQKLWSSVNWKGISFLSSYYILAVLSFLLTLNIEKGTNDLETKASFLVFPIFIGLFNQNGNVKRVLNKVLVCFALSNVLMALYTWFLIFREGFFYMLETDSYYNPVFRSIFREVTGFHLPYLGIMYGLSVLIMINLSFKKGFKLKYVITTVVCSIILIISMFFFTSRMALFSLFIAVIFYGIGMLPKRVNLSLGLVVFVIGIVLMFLNPIQRRVIDVFNTEVKAPIKNQQSKKVNFRYVIYTCSVDILKDNWLFGVGQGNVQKHLNDCYDQIDYKNYDDFKVKTYNTHNQYLNEWITYGLFGFIFLIFYLVFSVKSSNKLHRCFIIIIFLGLLTENLFETEAGVICFAFFNTLFFFNKQKGKE